MYVYMSQKNYSLKVAWGYVYVCRTHTYRHCARHWAFSGRKEKFNLYFLGKAEVDIHENSNVE
jgi:hypothetical protein